jgi:hypothetical protein
MNSTPSPDQTDPHNVAIAALKEACKQIGSGDDQLVGLKEQVSKLEQDAAGDPFDQQKRAAVLLRRSSPGRLASLWLIGLAVVASLSVAAFVWQSYGDAAKQAIARWAPERVLLVKQQPPAEPRPPRFEVTTADAALPPPAALAQTQTPPQDVPPKVALMSPELAQSFQTIAREIANLEHGIEQLKTDQEQMARDNAKAIEQLKASQEQAAHDNANATEQLKASQEQMARDNAKLGEQLKASQEQIVRVPKASEQNLRPKRSTPQPRPTATLTSKPATALRSPPARAQPQAPVQLQPEEQ